MFCDYILEVNQSTNFCIYHSVNQLQHRALLGVWDSIYHPIGAKIKKLSKAYQPSCNSLYKWNVTFIQVTNNMIEV